VGIANTDAVPRKGKKMHNGDTPELKLERAKLGTRRKFIRLREGCRSGELGLDSVIYAFEDPLSCWFCKEYECGEGCEFTPFPEDSKPPCPLGPCGTDACGETMDSYVYRLTKSGMSLDAVEKIISRAFYEIERASVVRCAGEQNGREEK
jgi:hypothetical protein